LEATKRDKEAQQLVSSQTRKTPFIRHPKPTFPIPPATPLNIHKLTRAEMNERQLKGLCYNYDDKCFLGHKCKEHKLFMAVFGAQWVDPGLNIKSPKNPKIPTLSA
jgi:hypothetical protein